MDAMDALPPGTPAPDFLLSGLPDRSPVHLSSLRGQPVVLAFSPPGWDPTRAEGLAQINRLLSQSGFPGELLGLSRDGAWCQASLPEGPMQFPLLTEDEIGCDVAGDYGVAGRQALFVVDEAGVIRWRYVAAPGISPRAEDLFAGLQSLQKQGPAGGLTRREFMAAALGVAFALSLNVGPAHAEAPPAMPPIVSSTLFPAPSTVGTVPVTLEVNGVKHALQIEPRVTLLDAVRDHIGLTGSKKGCDHGQCGACTMHINGRRILSCLTLAVTCPGKTITTIEGLAQGDALHPMQAAFIEHDGFQCGFCTSGQIMSATALLEEPVGPDDADVRENMSGNICRCGAYPNIVAAIQDVRKGNGHAPV
jgi:xanthine dehydrogenase YagT iron-sulfur-binding subunit